MQGEYSRPKALEDPKAHSLIVLPSFTEAKYRNSMLMATPVIKRYSSSSKCPQIQICDLTVPHQPNNYAPTLRKESVLVEHMGITLRNR
jgi:hypothetical protein